MFTQLKLNSYHVDRNINADNLKSNIKIALPVKHAGKMPKKAADALNKKEKRRNKLHGKRGEWQEM